MRGFIVSAGSSGAGKTLITLGLMKLFKDVNPFKVGPDFIDPSYHKMITKRDSYNLDLFMMGEEGVRYSFKKHLGEINIVEGVMGLYDGIDNSRDNFSTGHLSRVLQLPVILIINAKGRGISIAAEIMGYKIFDSRVNIAGVILNRVGSEKTYKILKDDIEKYTGVKCLGFLPENSEFYLESRHLGLLLADEVNGLREKINYAAKELEKNLDIEYIQKNFIIKELNYPNNLRVDVLDNFSDLKNFSNSNNLDNSNNYNKKNLEQLKNRFKNMRVAIAKDSAFSFYYQDNIEILEEICKEVIYFSPISDTQIPDVDLLYFGGGYPENHILQLSRNREMIKSIQNFHKAGGKIYAECGGFIYMSKGLYDLEGSFFPLCGVSHCSIKMYNRLDISRFGYVNISLSNKDSSESIGKGHEFHYSKIGNDCTMDKRYSVTKKDGRTWKCGYSEKNFIGGYPHLHFLGSMDILEKILEGVGNE